MTMNPADRLVLDSLRKHTRLTESQWITLEEAVVKAGGILNATGTAKAELMYCVAKARAEVLKHPGHADQAVHGNGGKNSRSSANGVAAAQQQAAAHRATAAGFAAQGNSEQQAKYEDLATGMEAVVSAGTPEGSAQAYARYAKSETKYKKAGQYDLAKEPARRGDGADAAIKLIYGVGAEDLAASLGIATFDKAVGPVIKHPGHADQSVHGNGGKNSKGGAAPGTSPDAARDEIETSMQEAQTHLNELSEDELEEMDSETGDALNQAGMLMESAQGHMDMFDPGGSEERLNDIRAGRALADLGEASELLRGSTNGIMQDAGSMLQDMINSIVNREIDWNGSGNPSRLQF